MPTGVYNTFGLFCLLSDFNFPEYLRHKGTVIRWLYVVLVAPDGHSIILYAGIMGERMQAPGR